MGTQPVIDFRFIDGQTINEEEAFGATVHNCNPFAVSLAPAGWGRLKSALEFKGPASFVKIPLTEVHSGAGQFAVGMVIRPKADRAARMNLAEAQSIPFSFQLVKSGTNLVLQASIHVNRRWDGIVADKAPIRLNQWTPVMLVYTGDDLLVFVRDRLVARRVLKGRQVSPVGRAGMFLGTWMDGRRDQYVGDMAGFQFWDEIPDRLLPAIENAEKQGIGEIDSKYLELGGPRGFLGPPKSAEIRLPTGRRMRTYQRGHIYWSADTDAHEVHGAILARYKALRGANGNLGLPLTDELAGTRRGCKFSRFENGAIYWSGTTGAHELLGEIFVRYMDLGAEKSVVGLPTSNEIGISHGRLNHFEYGDIYWSPSTGAFEVHGAILARYKALRAAAGFLGFPLSNETDIKDSRGRATGGKFSRFEGGTIYWSRNSGAFEVHGAIRDHYEGLGGPLGELGYPLTNETAYPGSSVRYNDFQKGVIAWRSGIGARAVTRLTLHIGKVNSSSIDDGVKFAGPIPIGKDKSAELVTYTTVKVGSRTLLNAKRGPSGHAGTSYDINKRFANIGPVRHNTRIYMKIKVYDWDKASGNDYLGTYEKNFDIRNFWGLTDGSPAGIYTEKWATHRGGDLPSASHLRFNYSIGVQHPIDPNKHFREQYWWRSDNFSTAILSRQQYADTFRDVENAPSTWDKIINPFDSIYYAAAYKGVASKGNCFGMSLEAIYARVNQSLFLEPIYQHKMNPSDNWDNTPKPSRPSTNILDGVRRIINERHGYQVGASAVDWVIGKLVSTAAVRPLTVYSRVKYYLARRDWPVISMMNLSDFTGHAVMPYACRDGSGSAGNPHKIFVADPNVPWRRPRSGGRISEGDLTYIAVYSNNTFRTVNMPSAYQSSRIVAGLLPGTLMFEIPYHRLSSQPRTPFWEILLALTALVGGMLLIFGSAESEQVKGDNRQFYRLRNGRKVGVRQNGIPNMVRLPLLDVSGPVPEIYAQRGRLPATVEAQVRGTRRGRYSQMLASKRHVVALDTPVEKNARDRLIVEGTHTPKPLVRLTTSQGRKVAKIDYSVFLDATKKDLRHFSVNLQMARGAEARLGLVARGTGLVLEPAGPSRPVTVNIETVINRRKAVKTLRVTPKPGEVLRIRPIGWGAGPVVLERMTSIDGGIISRIIKP